jgi:hypothetical protein
VHVTPGLFPHGEQTVSTIFCTFKINCGRTLFPSCPTADCSPFSTGHWSLAVVCRPGLLQPLQPGKKKAAQAPAPFVLHFDSLPRGRGGHDTALVAKRLGRCGLFPPQSSKQPCLLSAPKILSLCDCGIIDIGGTFFTRQRSLLLLFLQMTGGRPCGCSSQLAFGHPLRRCIRNMIYEAFYLFGESLLAIPYCTSLAEWL